MHRLATACLLLLLALPVTDAGGSPLEGPSYCGSFSQGDLQATAHCEVEGLCTLTTSAEAAPDFYAYFAAETAPTTVPDGHLACEGVALVLVVVRDDATVATAVSILGDGLATDKPADSLGATDIDACANAGSSLNQDCTTQHEVAWALGKGIRSAAIGPSVQVCAPLQVLGLGIPDPRPVPIDTTEIQLCGTLPVVRML